MYFVASRVELNQRISPLYSDMVHARTEVFELEVRASRRTLVLLVLVLEVDSFVIV